MCTVLCVYVCVLGGKGIGTRTAKAADRWKSRAPNTLSPPSLTSIEKSGSPTAPSGRLASQSIAGSAGGAHPAGHISTGAPLAMQRP